MFEWLKLALANSKDIYYPLPKYNGRYPVISSKGHWNNKSRPTHNGVDIMYKRLKTDNIPVKDGKGAKHFIVPKGTVVHAVKDGIVRSKSYGKIKTGYRLWIQHEDGYRSGYFHLSSIIALPGRFVPAGSPIGIVGDNPSAHDPRHLHFEVSYGVNYKPVNPVRFLSRAKFIG